MFVMLGQSLGALGASAIPAASAVDILFSMGQQQITDPGDRSTFTTYGRSYINDFVNDFYKAGFTLVSDPGTLPVANGAQLLPIMQQRNSTYVFASLSPDQIGKMSSAIDSLPSSGYAFVNNSSLQSTPPPAKPAVSVPVVATPAPATPAELPVAAQTPQNVVNTASVPGPDKQPATVLSTFDAALSAVKAYAPLMPARAQATTAQLLMLRQQKGLPVYVPKKTSWLPWVLGATGIIVAGAAVVFFLKRKKGT